MAQRAPASCVWSSGSDAVVDLEALIKYVEESEGAIKKQRRTVDCVVLSTEAANAIDYMTKASGNLHQEKVLVHCRFLGMDLRVDDTQAHHLQVWAAGFPRVFASVFIHRELLAKLREDETQVLPVQHKPT